MNNNKIGAWPKRCDGMIDTCAEAERAIWATAPSIGGLRSARLVASNIAFSESITDEVTCLLIRLEVLYGLIV
jgi:hypothetical protein